MGGAGVARADAFGVVAALAVLAGAGWYLRQEHRQGNRALEGLTVLVCAVTIGMLRLPRTTWVSARHFIVLYPLVYF